MLLSFLDCLLQALGSLVCELMGVQSLWLFSPCSPFGANPPLICMDPSVGRAMCTKNRKTKIPQADTSDHTMLCYYFKKRNAEVQTESPCSVHLPADDTRSSFCPSFAKSELGNEWHLKARAGLLTPDFVWRSPWNTLWFRDVFIIPLLTLGDFFIFFSFFSPPPTLSPHWS